MAAVAVIMAVGARAQSIRVVDTSGNPISLANVLTKDGVLIGRTNLEGAVADVRGAEMVTLTHVAYKSRMADKQQMQEGPLVMEDLDYDIGEIVVKPKPYVYMEYFFRAFSYIDDSLRAYAAGIIPVAHEIQNGYKGKTHGVWSFGGAANKALIWNTQDLEFYAEKGAKDGLNPLEKNLTKSEKFKDYYKTTVEPDGPGRWMVKNPEGVVGHYQCDGKFYKATIDGGKMQMYANKVNGEDKKLKIRENRNYDYQYSEVFAVDDDGSIRPEDKIMEMDHWEHDNSKGRKITILYLYTADHAYMDEAEFKAKAKVMKKGRSGDMTLDELEEYARDHNIPPLSVAQQESVNGLTKKTGKK